MVKKIKITAGLIILLIIAVAVAAISVVNSQTVNGVEAIEMTANASSSVTVSWGRVKGADGYLLYISSDDGVNYENAADVNDGSQSSYEITGINSGSFYKVKVTAYKNFNKKVYEGEPSTEIQVYTLPDAVDLSVFSVEEGVLSASWTVQPNTLGYEFEYAKNEDFSDSEKQTTNLDSIRVEQLMPNDIYYVRARAEMKAGESNIYGDWSDVCRVGIRKNPVINPDIDPDKPMIALSFDDGPAFDYDGRNSTMDILNVLEEYGARVTFFMCGARINDENKRCLMKEIELGCELGNHTYDHKSYGSSVKSSDIVESSNAIKNACGQLPTLFRCPGGLITPSIREECRKEGMPLAYWSVDTEDWKSQDADKIYKEVMENAYDGAIVLMHDIYPSTASAVKKIVPKLIDDGYQLVTISEMIAAKNDGEPPQPGQQYVDCNIINNRT